MRNRRRVVALAYDGLGAFEFGIAAEVFAARRPDTPRDWYTFSVCGVDDAPMHLTGGLRVIAGPRLGGLRALREAGTIVIPGWRRLDDAPPPALIHALRTAAHEGARLISICSGAFVLAATGLLDGRRATTHWRFAAALAARYPAVHVEPNVLYVDEGNVLTSAGNAAGIDLCLHVVRSDFGAAVANRLASQLVVPPHRDGGQAQYIRDPMPTRTNGGLAPVMEWAVTRLGQPLGVRELAHRANMSMRTFARRFVLETGSTPHRWLTYQRLLAARHQLESTDASIEAVAVAVGFETAMTLRHHFRRSFGTTPTAYRRQFSLTQ
jgi:AraC family transcriptional regulator, transcriptional activator FtrA